MSKWLLMLGLLAGCATTSKVQEVKFAPGACLERASNDEQDTKEVVRVLGTNATQYILLVGVVEVEGGMIVVTERASINEVNDTYKKTACEDNSGAI